MATFLEQVGYTQPQTYIDYQQTREQLQEQQRWADQATMTMRDHSPRDYQRALDALEMPESPADQLAQRVDDRQFQVADFETPEVDLPDIPDMPDRPDMGIDAVLAGTDALPDELQFPDQPDIDFETPETPEVGGLDQFREQAETLLAPEFQDAQETMAAQQARRGMAGMPAADVMQRELADERAATELETALGLRQDEFQMAMQQFEGDLAAQEAEAQTALQGTQAQMQHLGGVLDAAQLEQQAGAQEWEMEMQERMTPFQAEMERAQMEHQMGMAGFEQQLAAAQFDWGRHMDVTQLQQQEHMFREEADLEQLLQEEQMQHESHMQRRDHATQLAQQAMQQTHEEQMMLQEYGLMGEQQLAEGLGQFGGAAMQAPGFQPQNLDDLLRQYSP